MGWFDWAFDPIGDAFMSAIMIGLEGLACIVGFVAGIWLLGRGRTFWGLAFIVLALAGAYYWFLM